MYWRRFAPPPVLQSLRRYAIQTGASHRDAALAAQAFIAFFSVLASYFLVSPLREEAAMQLGTDNIPKLFSASLLVMLVAAPVVTSVISKQSGHRLQGHQRLFCVLAIILMCFYAALQMAPAAPALLATNAAHLKHNITAPLRLVSMRHLQQEGDNHTVELLHLAPTAGQAGRTAGHDAMPAGHPAAPHYVRWARHLVGGRAERLAGKRAAGHDAVQVGHSTARRRGQGTAHGAQAWVLAAFYIWHGVQNLVGVSALWTMCADVFTPDAGARLFGFLTAGATAGQLAGSLLSMTFVRTAARLSTLPLGPPYLLLPCSAAFLLVAAQCCRAIGSDTTAHPTAHSKPPLHGKPSHDRSGGGGGGLALPPAHVPPPLPHLHVTAAAEGFRLIASSPFLLLLCLFIMLGYMVSSVVYFERTVVVAATMSSSGQRAAFFSTLNSCSASLIFVIQLFATGPLMQRLGVTLTLSVGPAVSLVGLTLVALRPTANMIAGLEVLRKVVQHTLSRPTRELIFTIVCLPS